MISRKCRGFVLLCLLLPVLAGCGAHNPLDLSRVDATATPSQVRQDFEHYRGRTVQWGGLVVSRGEEEGAVLLEILSYPLRDDGNPDEYREPTGLFRFRYTGPADLAGHQPGRFVTVVGALTGLGSAEPAAKGQPLPQVSGDQAHLWSWRNREGNQPRATFGFGLGLHF